MLAGVLALAISLGPIPGNWDYWRVESGDTLSSIGRSVNLTWQDLHHMNRHVIPDPNRIYPGQVIRVIRYCIPVAPGVPCVDE